MTDSKPQQDRQEDRFVVREMLPNKPGLFAIWDRQLKHYPDSDRDREKLQLTCDILNQAERDGTLAEHGLSLNV